MQKATRCAAVILMIFGRWVVLAADKPMGVCEALSNLAKLNRQQVTIEATLLQNNYHGITVLQDLDQPRKCAQLTGKRGDWPSTIYVSWTSQKEGSEAVGFTTEDTAAWRELYRAMSHSKWGIKARVEILGELRGNHKVRIVTAENGSSTGDGYGPSGEYAAELIPRKVVAVHGDISTFR